MRTRFCSIWRGWMAAPLLPCGRWWTWEVIDCFCCVRSFEKRHKTTSVHCSPCFRVKEGDVVTVGQCR